MKTALRIAEGALWLGGLTGLGSVATGALQAHAAHLQASAIQSSDAQSEHAAGAATEHAVIGRLEIPAIALSVPVLESYDPATLVRGVGHVPGTAVAGGLGNMVLAGHRDTFFRPLRRVHTGMEIAVVTAQGRFLYRIDSTEIVTPDAVRVLDIGNRPSMTLITCYPFDFIGAAPQRFIVNAHLVSDPA